MGERSQPARLAEADAIMVCYRRSTIEQERNDRAMAQTQDRPPTPQTAGGAAPTATAGQRLTAAERRAERAAQAKREQERRKRQTLIGGIGGAIALALAAFLFIRYQTANQVGVRIADEGGGHVTVDTPLVYKHYPPSSGKHYDTAQPAGINKTEVPEGNWVHSLEHGYIVVLLRCNGTSCDETYRQLQDLFERGLPKSKFGNVKFIATPYGHAYTAGDAPITLVAWNYEAKLQGFDRDKIVRFYTQHVDRGPEDIP